MSATTNPPPAIKLLSVTGAGRSGTTVLASILDGIEGFASTGELRRLWEHGVIGERPCACGETPAHCPVWSRVVERTLSSPAEGSPREALQRIVSAQKELRQTRNRLRLIRATGRPDQHWHALHEVRSAMREALAEFVAVTGAHVVVDTSKRAEDAAVLSALRGVDQYVLHLVRDPRAVVHSWRRHKSFSAGGSVRTMGTRRLPSSVRRWTDNCLSTELLLRRLPSSHWQRVRYEDFAHQPRAAVDRVLAMLDEPGVAPFEDEHTVRLRASHIVAGNPSRFATGAVAIRADEEWRERMPRRDQRIVEWTTRPLMRRYGYAGGR